MTSSVTTYTIQAGGTLTDPRSQSDGQAALCWILRVGGFYYVSNTASNTLSSFSVDAAGQPALVDAVAAATNPGPIDLAASGDFSTPRRAAGRSTSSASRPTEPSSRSAWSATCRRAPRPYPGRT